MDKRGSQLYTPAESHLPREKEYHPLFVSHSLLCHLYLINCRLKADNGGNTKINESRKQLQ